MAIVARSATEPIALYWAGQRLARAGDRMQAQQVLAALDARTVSTNRVHLASGDLLRAELLLMQGRAADAVRLARAGVERDSTDIGYETLSFALWHQGLRDDAARIYEVLADRRPTLGLESTLLTQRAPDALAFLRNGGAPAAYALPTRGSLHPVRTP
jgi:hypothetical protein